MTLPITADLANSRVLASWRYRELWRHLVIRDLRVRYQRSALGFAWTLLNPLLTISVLIVVFERFLHIGVPHYWAFLASGYFAWVFIQHTITVSASALRDHAHIVRNMPFPKEVLVLSTITTRLVEFSLEILLVMTLLALFHHHRVPASFALVPVLMVLQTLLVIGLALPMSVLATFFLDVQHALPVVLLIVSYASPIYYPVTLVPEAARGGYLLNPVAAIIQMYHMVLFEGRMPAAHDWIAPVAFAILFLVFGYVVFDRARPHVADVL